MRDRKAAARYARAFFEDAHERDAVDEAAGDLALLKQVWQRNPGLVGFLSHPLVAPERKQALCREHFGDAVDPEQMRFIDLLVERKRVGLLPEICDLFQEQVDDHRGIVRAHVRSAAPLVETERMRLHTLIGEVFGGQPLVVTSVHPELIGGVTVRVKDSVLDGSVRKSLEKLAADLRAAPLHGLSKGDGAGD